MYSRYTHRCNFSMLTYFFWLLFLFRLFCTWIALTSLTYTCCDNYIKIWYLQHMTGSFLWSERCYSLFLTFCHPFFPSVTLSRSLFSSSRLVSNSGLLKQSYNLVVFSSVLTYLTENHTAFSTEHIPKKIYTWPRNIVFCITNQRHFVLSLLSRFCMCLLIY